MEKFYHCNLRDVVNLAYCLKQNAILVTKDEWLIHTARDWEREQDRDWQQFRTLSLGSV